MKNRLIAGIMALCIVGGVGFIPENIAPAVSLTARAETLKSGTCGKNLIWTLDDEGTLTVSGTGEMDTGGFYNQKDLIKSVIINEGVTSIYYSVFNNCENLTSVTIPDSVTTIKSNAFRNCKNLTSVTIPDSVTSIEDNVFYNTPWLEEKRKENPLVIINNILIDARTCSGAVVIPDGVTSISDWAFYGCTGLRACSVSFQGEKKVV